MRVSGLVVPMIWTVYGIILGLIAGYLLWK